MGGQSFGCPFCDKWTLMKKPMKDHLKDKHGVVIREIVGVGKLKPDDLKGDAS